MIEDKPLIEFARPSDADEIGFLSKSEIEAGLGWKYTPERVVRLIADNTKNTVVARVGACLAGFGIMTYGEDQANLDLLAVKRSFRRMGIGSRIVTWLEEVALTAGAYNVFLQVRSQNGGAVAFYERLGYQVVDAKRGYYRGVETGLIMAKALRRMFDAT